MFSELSDALLFPEIESFTASPIKVHGIVSITALESISKLVSTPSISATILPKGIFTVGCFPESSFEQLKQIIMRKKEVYFSCLEDIKY